MGRIGKKGPATIFLMWDMVSDMKEKRISQKGFTLIEMLAVLFIIGIIFSITLPTFGPIMGTLRLTTAAENIANALESARQYASTSGIDCRVIFPTTGEFAYRAYKLYSYDGKTGKTVGKIEVLPTNIKIGENSSFLNYTMDAPFPEDTSSSQPVAYIEFEPDGSAKEGGSIYVTDPNTNTFQKITFIAEPMKVSIKEIGEDSE